MRTTKSGPRTLSNLSIIVANFRSIISKQDELLDCIHTCSADVVLGTEVWLYLDISDTELIFAKSFKVYRKDGDRSRGGGVMIAIKNGLPSSLVRTDSSL